MRKKITFNFFDDSMEESIEKVATYFDLDENEVLEYIESVEEPAEIEAIDFIKKFGINLTAYDCRNAEIVCKHMSVLSVEGIADVKEKGLFDLLRMLTEDTVLSRFLKENQVEFDIQNRKLLVDGKDYMITTTDEECLLCFEKKEIRCGVFSRCDIREKMDSIGRKIYELGGTLEFFVAGTREDMERYSVIHLNPEILETLDQLLGKIKIMTKREETFSLSYKWREQERKTYVLQFPVSLADIEAFCVCDYERAYYKYKDILECSGYTHSDYLMRKIPDKLYQNMELIDWFLVAGLCSTEQVGSLLPGKMVEPAKIHIVEEYVR